MGLAMVFGLVHFTFCHTSSPRKPASPQARSFLVAFSSVTPDFLATCLRRSVLARISWGCHEETASVEFKLDTITDFIYTPLPFLPSHIRYCLLVSFNYFAPRWGAKYSYEYVCLSVCLFVCPLASFENQRPIFTKFFVRVTCGNGSVRL